MASSASNVPTILRAESYRAVAFSYSAHRKPVLFIDTQKDFVVETHCWFTLKESPGAGELVSIAADVRICQIVNPRVGARVVIPKAVVGDIYE